MSEELHRCEPLIERDGASVAKSPWGEDDQIGRLSSPVRPIAVPLRE